MVFTAVRLIRTGTRETHHGQENTLHKKAGYIDADCSRPSAFLLQSCGGPYIVERGRATASLVPDCSWITGKPHLTLVRVGCCSRARVCLDRRSETQIFVDTAALLRTYYFRSSSMVLRYIDTKAQSDIHSELYACIL